MLRLSPIYYQVWKQGVGEWIQRYPGYLLSHGMVGGGIQSSNVYTPKEKNRIMFRDLDLCLINRPHIGNGSIGHTL
jgi:hypothetical protein